MKSLEIENILEQKVEPKTCLQKVKENTWDKFLKMINPKNTNINMTSAMIHVIGDLA